VPMADRPTLSAARNDRAGSNPKAALASRSPAVPLPVPHRLAFAGLVACVTVAFLLVAPVAGLTMAGPAAVPGGGHAPSVVAGLAVHSTAERGRASTAPSPPHRMPHPPPGLPNPGTLGVAPSVLDTLVLLNNTVVPGNFLATLGLGPAAVAYDAGTHEIFSADFGSNTVTVIDDRTNIPVTSIPVGNGPAELAYDGGRGELFVANQYSGTVSVLSDSTNTVVATIGVGSAPNGVAYDPALGEVFVANGGSNNVSVISDSNNSVVTSIGVGNTPQGLALDSARNAVFVANENSWNMSVISTTNNTVVANFLVNTNVSVGYYGLPIAVAYDPARAEIFVADYATSNVTVLNDSTYAVVATVPVGIAPAALAYDNTTAEVYVANQYSRNLTVINDSSNLPAFSIPVGQGPVGVVYDGGTSSIYVANSAKNLLNVVGPGTHTVLAQIVLADTPGAIAYDPGAGELFVANGNLGTVSVISDTTDRVVAQVGVGSDPSAVAYDGATGQLFVANLGSNNVSVISDSNNSVVANINVGLFPGALAYDAGKAEVYVADFFDGNVSVLSATTDSLSTTISVGGAPDGVAYDAGKGEVFVANLGGNVSVINDTSNSVVATVGVGTYPDAVTYDPNGEIFVANYFSSNVTVISDSNDTVVANTNVGLYPSAMAYDRGDIVVANYLSNNVSFLSDANNSLVTTVAVAAGPQGAAFDAGNDLVYVTNVNQGTISILWGPSPPTSISSFAPTPPAISLGSLARFVVTATGGTGNYSFQFTGLPAGCASSDTHLLTCTPTSAGTYPVKVYVNDTTGSGSGSRAAATTTLTVNPHDAILTFSATPANLSLGSSTSFRVSVTGGTGALAYLYTGVPRGCSTLDTPSLDCSPSVVGTFNVTVLVTDSTGSRVSANVTLTVNPHASIAVFSASPATLDVNGSTNLTVAATGGTGTLGYTYTGLPGGCSTQDRALLQCSPAASGTFVVMVYVNDSTGSGSTAILPIVVNPQPSVSAVTASPAIVNLGSSTNLQLTTAGGTGVLQFVYAGLPQGCATIDAPSLTCTPTAVGTFGIEIFVNDTAGGAATAAVSLVVDPTLTSVDVRPTATVVAVNGQITLTAAPNCAGGPCPSGPTYVWSLGRDLGTLSSTMGAITTFTAGATAGPTTISVVATLNGVVSPSGSVAITVASSVGPDLASLTLNVAGAQLPPGGSQSFTVTPVCSGGACPSNLAYTWVLSQPLGSLSTTSGPSTSFIAGSAPGTVYLNVTTSLNGISRTATATLTISPTPSPTPSSSGASVAVVDGLAVALIVAIVVAVTAIALLLRQRGPRNPPPPPVPQEAGPSSEFDSG
jgi:YVTN family beta-propeller protein